MLELTDQNFEKEVLKSKELVLVDFWSPTCPSCIMLAPVIDKIAKEFKNKAEVGKLDVYKNPKIADQYQITSIPTIIIFKDGEIKEKMIGFNSKEDIAEKLNLFL